MQRLAALVVFALLLLPFHVEAAFTVISSAKSTTVGADSTTTATFDSTGADTLIAFEAWYNAGTTPTLSDSQSNGSWTCKTINENVADTTKTRLCSIHITSTNASHTVTSAGTGAYTGLIVLALSGGDDAPDDTGIEDEGTIFDASRFDFDSITPSVNDCIVVIGIGTLNAGSDATGATGYTQVQELAYGSGTNGYAWMAYKIQTTAGAEAPQADGAYTGFLEGSIGSFKPDDGMSPPVTRRGLTTLGIGR